MCYQGGVSDNVTQPNTFTLCGLKRGGHSVQRWVKCTPQLPVEIVTSSTANTASAKVSLLVSPPFLAAHEAPEM